MKIIPLFACVATVASIAVLASWSGEDPKKPAAPAGDDAAMQQKWTAYATPGDAHKVLAPRVGKWTMKVKMYKAAGAPAEESNATSDVQWVLDGRFIEDHTTGEMMGQPFHGLGLTGYDNMKKKYVSTWTDTMITGILHGEGTYDAATKTITSKTQMPDVMSGKYNEVRSTEKAADNDHRTMQMFAPGTDGKEYMMMEIQYTRAK